MKLLFFAFSVLVFTACASKTTDLEGKLPPDAIVVPLVNSLFDADSQGRLSGWVGMEHNRGGSYTFVADKEVALSPPTSLRIQRHGDEAWGFVEQVIKIPSEWVGKTARLSGYLRTKNVSNAGGALLIQTRSSGGSPITYDHMTVGRPVGTQDWKRYSVQVKIPTDARVLMVGAMLEDGGTLWVDDLSLVVLPQ